MYLDNSNLSAEHIKQLKYSVGEYNVSKNKFGLMRDVITEGVDIPRGLDIDKMFMRMNACIKS